MEEKRVVTVEELRDLFDGYTATMAMLKIVIDRDDWMGPERNGAMRLVWCYLQKERYNINQMIARGPTSDISF